MIAVAVEPQSLAAVESSVPQIQERIRQAIVEGMFEAMEGLASNVADKLFGDPIQSRTGALLQAILESPKVSENGDLIRGSISSDVGKKHVGLWLEFGTHVRATLGKLYGFMDDDGELAFTRGHKAFEVGPKSFLNPSLREDEENIADILAAKLAGALNG